MGTLYWGSVSQAFDVDDDELRHFEALVVAKLRRREPFLLCCVSAQARDSLWIHGSTNLRYTFSSPEPVALDRARLERMMQQANRTSGLLLESMTRRDVTPVATQQA